MKFLEGVPMTEPCSDISHPPALPSLGLRFGISYWTGALALRKLCGLFIPAIFYLPPRMASGPPLCPPAIAWLTCALCSNPSEAESLCISSLVPSQAGKKSPASYNFAAAAFWRPSQTRTARLRVLSNRPTHNHPSKRAVSPEVKSPVFNIKPSTGPVFLFPGDSGT